ncbi:acetyl-CoA C-acyltransferase [Pseudomonadota bacterium]
MRDDTNNEVVILASSRTPMGGFQGVLHDAPCTQLGATAIQGVLEQAPVAVETIGEVIMGCVLPAGLGQAPARQAALGANLPKSIGCTTINKMCGSGMKAAMLAFDSILAGSNNVVVAGGMESMSNAPYLSAKARSGLRIGHSVLLDHMFIDGLEDAYDKGRLMGTFAEDCAHRYNLSREVQDNFAIESLTRAKRAIVDGSFDSEIKKVEVKTRKTHHSIEQDEQPLNASLEKIPYLKPAFKKDGTVTAANSSSISDGAAALIIARRSIAEQNGINPKARIIGHTTYAHDPEWFTTAPISAIRSLMSKIGWTNSDVDLFEINEAFAVVTLAAMAELDLPHDKVNVHGGACALGHPIGASGARIIVTLLNALEKYDLKRGIAALCIGGGEATAVAIER